MLRPYGATLNDITVIANKQKELAMKFNYVVGAGSSVKTIDVLCDYDHSTTLFFQTRFTLGNRHVSLQVHNHHHSHHHHHQQQQQPQY